MISMFLLPPPCQIASCACDSTFFDSVNGMSGDAPEWLGTAVGSWTCALDVRHLGNDSKGRNHWVNGEWCIFMLGHSRVTLASEGL